MRNVGHQIQLIAEELKRRKVVRTAVAYIVSAGVLIGLAADAVPALYLPDSVVTLVVILAFLGLPAALALSWHFDVTRDAGRAPEREHDNAAPARQQPRTGRTPGTTLTPSTTAFIGRSRELAELAELLSQPGCQLVTVIGPGGVGKTRLALRYAEVAAPSYAHGIVRVGLTSLSSPELLPHALLDALGVTAARRDDGLEDVLDFLREKQMLLVLDNTEHLVHGMAVLNRIMDAAPGVQLIATSRERLNLQSESLLVLGGLSTQTNGGGEGDAVQLFRTTARRLDRRFDDDPAAITHARQICELLEGVPLAIELAASWVRVMSCAEILQELQRGLGLLAADAPDMPQRHRSLRATFDGSWAMLQPEERQAAARLSVFRSSFDRHAAEAVAGAAPGTLRALLDKSLLKRELGGFVMLNVVRQYGRERLQQDPVAETTTLRLHADWYTALLRRLGPGIIRCNTEALAETGSSINEIRAAWQHALACRDFRQIGAMLDPLYHFYEARGWAREGADAFQAAVSCVGAVAVERQARRAAPSAEEAMLLGRLQVRCGALLSRLGDTEQASHLLTQGLAAAKRSENELEQVFVLQKWGAALLANGKLEEAAQIQQQALQGARRTRDRHAIGWSLMQSGNVLQSSGEYEGAERLYDEALQILRADDDSGGVYFALNNLGVIAGLQRQFEQARNRLTEALALPGARQNRRSAAMLLHNLGWVCREMGDDADAEQYIREALAISEEMGYRTITVQAYAGLAELLVNRGDLAAAGPYLDRALRLALSAGNQRLLLQCLGIAAHLRMRAGDPERAALLARAVAAHRASGEDVHRYALRLLEQLGSPAGDPADATPEEVNALARQVLEESSHDGAIPVGSRP
jgi:tetratricopeptide (TPR) repeat protein